jgi:lipopolysaccharide export system protein LptC
MKVKRLKSGVALLLVILGVAYLTVVTDQNPERERAAALRHQTPMYYPEATRAVNTDSLYRLYHAAMRSSHPSDYFQEIMCEGYRIAVKNGAIPTKQAVKRMEDTLWSPVERQNLREFRSRLETTVNVDYRVCGMPWDTPLAPIELNYYPTGRSSSSDSIPHRMPAHEP